MNITNKTIYLTNASYGVGMIIDNNVYVVEDDIQEIIEDLVNINPDLSRVKVKLISEPEFDQREQEIALKATRS